MAFLRRPAVWLVILAGAFVGALADRYGSGRTIAVGVLGLAAGLLHLPIADRPLRPLPQEG